MMKIIKWGKAYRFGCDSCGCVWEAGARESRLNEKRIRVCSCPCCGKTIEAMKKDSEAADAEDYAEDD